MTQRTADITTRWKFWQRGAAALTRREQWSEGILPLVEGWKPSFPAFFFLGAAAAAALLACVTGMGRGERTGTAVRR